MKRSIAKKECRLWKAAERTLALLLTAVVLLQVIPITTAADGEPCPHHQEHTATCGYVEPVECTCPTNEEGVQTHVDGCPWTEGSKCTFQCPVCPIEEKINQLSPEQITQDTGTVTAQAALAEIDAAVATLPEGLALTESAAEALTALRAQVQAVNTSIAEAVKTDIAAIPTTIDAANKDSASALVANITAAIDKVGRETLTTAEVDLTSYDTAVEALKNLEEISQAPPEQEPTYYCGKEAHTHSAENNCFAEDGGLTCEKEEHTHTEECQTPPKQEPTYNCGKEAHTHSVENGCYAEDGRLTCEKEEHTHTEACQTPPEQEPEYTCGQTEHTHSVENGCYDSDGTTLTCKLTEHTHTSLCLLTPEDRVRVQAVDALIAALPTAEEYSAYLATKAGEDQAAYTSRIRDQLAKAQAAYEALGETLQAYVTDAARLAELADVLPQEVDLDAPIAQGDVAAVLKRLADLKAALDTLVAGYDDCPAFMERMFTAYSACFEEDNLIVSQEDIQQVDQAFDHLEEVLFENFEYFYAWPYDPSSLSPATFSLPTPRSGDAGGTDSGGELVLDKWVTGDQENGYTLTLTAYATGTTVRKQVTKPMDIVLVLDQSCSMYKPMGYTGDKFTGSNTNVSDLNLDLKVLLSNEGKENASHRGYYIAQSIVSERLYMVEYTTKDGQWRLYRFEESNGGNKDSTHASFNDDLPNPTHIFNDDDMANHQFNFYKTQYATLYDSIVDFINILHQNGAAHRIAIVGFSGMGGVTTNLYVNGSQIRTPTDEQYENALEYVNTNDGYTSILSSLSAYKTQYGFTYASAGLEMAQNVFSHNSVPLDSDEVEVGRGRMVIFYTDGLINGGDGFNNVISKAYTLKNTYGATFYSFGTGDVVNQKYMTYASSNYPDATSLAMPGDEFSEDYLISANSEAEMNRAFRSALKSVQVVTSNTMVELDEYTILQDVISDYFELPENAQSDIKVYTADYTGRDTEGNRTFDDENKQELQGAQVTIDSSGTDDRQDTIRVTGFNYAKNHVEDRGEVVSEPRGKKLIVQIPIEVRAGFWGGNNVPTNEKGDSFGGTGTAIFNPERDADGTPVENGSADFIQAFPVPEVNVSFEPTIQAVNKVFYYGSDVGLQALVKEHSITVNGVEVLVGNDGTLTPKENWMDDYATLTWVNDTTGTAQKVNTTACKNDYEFGVVLKPKAACTTNPDGPAPIGGEFPLEGKKKTAKSSIHILVPVLTFQDSEITEAQRENLNADYYNKNNYVKTTPITWVDMIGDAEIGQKDATDTEPDLHLSYTPDLGYTHHIPVEVTVRRDHAITGTNITTVTTFEWNDCSLAVHKDEHDIEEHMGSEQSPEFRIHVLGFRLPDTGGMGTGRYTVGGLLLLMGAGLLLLRGRKRHGKGGFPAL